MVELSDQLAQIAHFVAPLLQSATKLLVFFRQHMLLAQHILHFKFLFLAISCGSVLVLLLFPDLSILYTAPVSASTLFGWDADCSMVVGAGEEELLISSGTQSSSASAMLLHTPLPVLLLSKDEDA